MEKESDLQQTSEIYARRFLNYEPSEAVIVWAEKMVLSGFVSDSLFVLMGEVEPFNKFEIDELLDRISIELQLPEIRDRNEALKAIATPYVQRFIQGKTGSTDTLYRLSQICIKEGSPEVIYDFYLLHYASVDLATHGAQHYWPGAHRGNIEEVILDICTKWLQEHSIAAWSKFEWTEA